MFSFSSTALLLALALTLEVSASPLVQTRESTATLPFSRLLNTTSGMTIADRDRLRAAQLVAKAKELQASNSDAKLIRRQSSFDVTNEAVVYVASVGVGSPATDYSLLIDTGSSNTWIGAGKSYVKTTTSVSTGGTVSVTYGSGSFSGEEYTDTVTLSSALVITDQGIGVASRSSGFEGYDGILGIGPLDLTEDTVSNADEVPTVTDNLFTQGKISEEVVGVYFAPTTSDSVTNGELTFGGVDTSKTTGSVTYTSLTTTYPASAYWGIDQTISYGSTELFSSAGIVDTGTTLILLASNVYEKYVSDTGATLDNTVGLLRISSTQFSALEDLTFDIGGTNFVLTANGQIWPRSLNTAIGGSSSDIYLIVADLGTPSGEGLDFINGYTFLERFYSVFDTTNDRVGFATTSETTATTN